MILYIQRTVGIYRYSHSRAQSLWLLNSTVIYILYIIIVVMTAKIQVV